VSDRRRSSISWKVRPSDSKGSARITSRAVDAATPVAMTAVPDRRKRLSDGTLVEASILVRLLGIRLLTLDATMVLVPADATAAPSAPHDSPADRSARSSGLPPTRSRPVGRGLADAVRTISEAAEILAEVRRNSP
jgi:hypothetical protein